MFIQPTTEGLVVHMADEAWYPTSLVEYDRSCTISGSSAGVASAPNTRLWARISELTLPAASHRALWDGSMNYRPVLEEALEVSLE